MIIKRIHVMSVRKTSREWIREGWYLFGFIPLYVRDLSQRGRKWVG